MMRQVIQMALTVTLCALVVPGLNAVAGPAAGGPHRPAPAEGRPVSHVARHDLARLEGQSRCPRCEAAVNGKRFPQRTENHGRFHGGTNAGSRVLHQVAERGSPCRIAQPPEDEGHKPFALRMTVRCGEIRRRQTHDGEPMTQLETRNRPSRRR